MRRAILNTILLVPGDFVFVVHDLKNKIVIKSKIEKVILSDGLVSYGIEGGKVKCSRCKHASVGIYLPCVTEFKNSNIDTGVPVEPFGVFIFTNKDKCTRFLRMKGGSKS